MKKFLAQLWKAAGRRIGNIPGWRTNENVIVIVSDDWGSVRMASKKAYNRLLAGGIPVDRCPYNRYDSLASAEDLSNLFEVLSSVKDGVGKYAALTANTIVANPDFEKIRAANFEKYFYEPFTTTLQKYPHHHGSFALWKSGMEEGIFFPQLHGREHVNVSRWMAMLSGNNAVRSAFNENVFGLSKNVLGVGEKNLMSAFDIDLAEELTEKDQIARSGADLFLEIFKQPSESFIAPSYIWNSSIEMTLKNAGVFLIQSNPFQKVPGFKNNRYRRAFHFTGQENRFGQRYIVRNAYFEPTISGGKLGVDHCMTRIAEAFRLRKPAIISTHRLNFIGEIDVNNRDQNLRDFRQLLKKIVQVWPDVRFMNIADLGNLMIRPGEEGRA